MYRGRSVLSKMKYIIGQFHLPLSHKTSVLCSVSAKDFDILIIRYEYVNLPNQARINSFLSINLTCALANQTSLQHLEHDARRTHPPRYPSQRNGRPRQGLLLRRPSDKSRESVEWKDLGTDLLRRERRHLQSELYPRFGLFSQLLQGYCE